MTATKAHQAGDWRVVDQTASAWFDAPSHAAGAALAARIAHLTGESAVPGIDLRATGVRVRIDDATLAGPVSAAARELGLVADPSALQIVRLVIDAAAPESVGSFWQTVLGYLPDRDAGLIDPWQRDPAVRLDRMDDPRPLRNRIHVDIVRPMPVVQDVKAALGREPSGPYGVAFGDAEGNEIDLVPGDQLPEAPGTDDWRAVFSAVACYPVRSARLAAELGTVVARLADDAGIPLLVDLRPDAVTIDSGKDQWENEQGAVRTEFADLAARIQAAARDLGLAADPARPRFVQFGIDAVDIRALRAFWTAVLGYRYDPRPHVTDIYDPRRLSPVLFFQQLDATDRERRRQRNRIRFNLLAAHDHARTRVDAALAAGGRIIAEEQTGHWLVADPEGNEIDIIAASDGIPDGA